MSDLDQILSDEPIAVEEPEQVEQEASEPEVEPETVSAEPEAEDSRDKQIAGLQAALSEVRGEVRTLKAKEPEPEPERVPDVFEDQLGYNEYQDAKVAREVTKVKLDLSEEITRAAHGDEKVDAAFSALQASQDPAVFHSIMQTRNPWGELVKWHEKKSLLTEIGSDPDAYRARIEAEVRAKLEKEAMQSAEKVAETVSQVANAPSLASDPNLGTRAAPEWGGPPSLNDILGG